MNYASMSTTWKQSIAISRLLILANILLAAALTAAVTKLANQHERLVIIPPAVDKKVIINWDSATPDYHKSMGYYLAGLIGSAAPKNVDFVASVIERFSSPEIATSLVRNIRRAAISLNPRTQHQVAWFEGKLIQWEDSTGKVFVIGDVTQMVGSFQNKLPVVYEFKFVVRDGQAKIIEFDSYVGAVPHTEEWKMVNAGKIAAEAEAKKASEAAEKEMGN